MSVSLPDSPPTAASANIKSPWSPVELWQRVPKPALICWLVYGVLTALGALFMEYAFTNSGWLRWYAETVIVSFFLGQIALATIIGGLAGRHWINSWFFAVGLFCFHTVIMMAVAAVFRDSERWAMCSFWPVLLLSTCAPLVLLRTLWGWTLARQASSAIPRQRASLEDLMMVGVIIACSITITQIMMFTQGPRSVPELLLVMGMFAGVSLVCIPATVYVSFRFQGKRRLLAWLTLSAVAFVATFVCAVVVDTGRGRWQTAIGNMIYMFIGVPTSCITVAVGIMALQASGYRLTYFEKRSAESQCKTAVPCRSDEPNGQKSRPADDWLNDADDQVAQADADVHSKWLARMVAAIVVLVAATGGISIQLSKQRASRIYKQWRDAGLRKVHSSNGVVRSLDFGPGFVDADLANYKQYHETLRRVSLAGTQATDSVFGQLEAFPSVVYLDLSGTQITKEGVLKSRVMQNGFRPSGFAMRVSLADTELDWPTAAALSRQLDLRHLDVSGLNVTDEQLQADEVKVMSLKLSRNPVTDAGMSSLLVKGTLRHLDLTDTAIVGNSLAVPDCPTHLVLDGTQVNDASLTAILKTTRVQQLSIARTKITAAMLPRLKGVKRLRLGDGPITEDHLIQMGPAGFEKLALNSRQFTGECLGGGVLHANELDLSNSGLNDDMARNLSGRWYQQLNLANTAITDQSLPYLQASRVDLRGTKVTANGLLNRPYFGVTVISYDQFPPEDMAKLRHALIETDIPVETYDDQW